MPDQTNPFDGSKHCSRSDCCILGYGHKGGCIVDAQDIADDPEHNSYAFGVTATAPLAGIARVRG